MNVLLVDDEIYVVRALQKNINWTACEIDNAFIAFNAAKAREVLQKETVDILVTDIEMPGESGISLAKWIRDQNLHTEIVFLTSHEEFSYAQEAMHVGVIEYVVKPVDFKSFEELIRKTVAKIHEDQEHQKNAAAAEQLESLSDVIHASFWTSIITGRFSNDIAEIQKQADQYDLKIDFSKAYQLVMLTLKEADLTKDNSNYKSRSEAEQKIMSLMEDTIIPEYCVEDYGWIYHRMWILFSEDGMPEKEGIERFIRACNELLGINTAVYVGGQCYIEEIYASFRQLETFDFENVSTTNGIVDTGASFTGTVLDKEFFKSVSQFLATSHYKELKEYIAHTKEKDQGISSDELFFAAEQFLYEMHLFADRKGINVRDIYQTGRESGYMNILRSKEELYRFMFSCSQYLADNESQRKSESELVQKIQKYIQDHLEEKIVRDDIAKHVNFSVDYLSRIYKSEMGRSLTEYIAEQKMKLACKLLAEGKMSVSDISVQLGYSSLSYFSDLFKKVVGCLPSEYSRRTEFR